MTWDDALSECMLWRRPVSIFRHQIFPGSIFTMNEWNWPSRYEQ